MVHWKIFQWSFSIRNVISLPFYLSWTEYTETGKLISGLGELARRKRKEDKGIAMELQFLLVITRDVLWSIWFWHFSFKYFQISAKIWSHCQQIPELIQSAAYGCVKQNLVVARQSWSWYRNIQGKICNYVIVIVSQKMCRM